MSRLAYMVQFFDEDKKFWGTLEFYSADCLEDAKQHALSESNQGIQTRVKKVDLYSCYQCDQEVTYLFEDGRCNRCTRLTPEEIRGH